MAIDYEREKEKSKNPQETEDLSKKSDPNQCSDDKLQQKTTETPLKSKGLKEENEVSMGEEEAVATTTQAKDSTKLVEIVTADETPIPPPGEAPESDTIDSRKEEMIEQYYQYQKEKRELRRRNLQAQTNIAQFFRKHKINPFPTDPEKSQTALREDYNKLLARIELLASDKERETNFYENQMQGITERTKVLQNDIVLLNKTLADMRFAAAKNSIHLTSGKTLSTRDVTEYIKLNDDVSSKMQPVRLEYAKLKRKHSKLLENWNQVAHEKDEGVDSVEIALENQVFNEKAEQRQDELLQLKEKMENDIIILSHIKVKYTQVKDTTRKLSRTLEDLKYQTREYKKLVCHKKTELFHLNTEKELIEDQLGMLEDEKLLQDLVKTKERIIKLESNKISI